MATAIAAVPGSQAALPPPPAADFYGVTSATDLTSAELGRMAAGGVRVLRVPFYWPHIEPKPPSEPVNPVPGLPAGLPEDQSRWGGTDKVVGRAAQHGVRVLPFVYGTPRWVAQDPERPPIDNRTARDAWQDLLADLVHRYGPGGEFWQDDNPLDPGPAELPIVEWQIWNEANSPVFWSPRPSPAEYGKVVALAGKAIRAADPAATVVLGGMFGTPSNGIPAEQFLARFHRRSEPGSFDVYALHPYSPNLSGIAAQARGLRRVIESGPMPEAPLWITEIGWPTDGPAGFELVKSEQGQKRLLARSFRLFLTREEWRIGKVIWYVWRDNDVQAECTVCRYSGLFTERLEAKPAWRKLTEFTGGTP